MNEFLKDKKVNKKKLLQFGFREENNKFIFTTYLLNNEFKLSIVIDSKGNLNTRLIECATNEIYTLHLVKMSRGNFVGKIKEEYNYILKRIQDECFEPDIFKSYQAKKLIEYIKLKYNNELEFLWEKYPQNAIVRRKDNAKWYALFLTIPKQKLGFDDKNVCEIINLKANDIDKIVDNKSIFPGYHMNKKHWITIILDNKVPLDFIKNKIDKSYILAKNSK